MLRTLIKKKVIDPIYSQLKQGVSPHKLALSLAFGGTLGIFPVLGSTTLLCFIAAFIFKLNHVSIQAMNYVCYSLQILFLIPFIRMGEWIFKRTPATLNILDLMNEFSQGALLFIKKYSFVGLMGVTAWLIISPFIFLIIYSISFQIFKKVMLKK